MLFNYLLLDPIWWIVPWILQAIGYSGILRKLELPRWQAVIPVLAERAITQVMYPRMRTFYRPFILSAIFLIGAAYLGPSNGTGLIYRVIAFVIYGIFLIRLYRRLCHSFGKGHLFTILTILLPPVFLLILGRGSAEYINPPKARPMPVRSKASRNLRRAGLVAISAAEVLVIAGAVGLYTVRTLPPRLLVRTILQDNWKQSEGIEATGDIVTRDETMGADAAAIADLPVSREHFYPDHSQDESVVVMEYIIGSNLEDRTGLASFNIRQMQDATKQGDGLTFVVQAGGSGRWFTSGVKDNSYGRYSIRDGKIEKALDLSDDTEMSRPEPLADFISWTHENYPADRYMLVLWDHGGGLSSGYGQDMINVRRDNTYGTMLVSEFVDVLKTADVKFDLIGFDACLMQDIEICSALEPYADYYLASEEVESGFGWYYTCGFGQLAQNPGMSTEDFGTAMVASFDPYNTALSTDGQTPDTGSTLALVDLTLARPAYQQLAAFFRDARTAVRDDSGSYADISLSAMNAYTFYSQEQIDLIHFLTLLDQLDYKNEICSQQELDDLIRAVRACVICRNGNSAEGINGMAVTFPYQAIGSYTDVNHELKELSFRSQRSLYDDFFSIMAYQNKKNLEAMPDDGGLLSRLLQPTDYTKASWYVKGFEDYDTQKTFVDIPLTEEENGFRIGLPEKTWKIIADCQTIVYQRTEEGLRYLGSDRLGDYDANGHPMVAMDDTWVHLNGNLISYEGQSARETDDGIVYLGTTRARLNNDQEIILYIEWDPVLIAEEDESEPAAEEQPEEQPSEKSAEGSAEASAEEEPAEEPEAPAADLTEVPVTGHITGYDYADNESAYTEKGTHALQAGDQIEILFDYYDDEGIFIETRGSGKKIRVTKMERLKVTDDPLPECDILFGGLLKDVYQRDLLTEMIEAHIDAL